MPGPQVSHRRALAEKRRAGHARPLPGCSRRHELAGTHICVPYKLSGNTRVVYRGENTVGAGHARPAGIPQAGACGKAQGRACPAPTAMQILRIFVLPPDDLGL